jgi:hypothetical protein
MEFNVWSLWLPILVSGVALFFASWAAWMVLPHHKGEWHRLPNEQTVMDTLTSSGVQPGQYSFPHCASSADWKNEEFKARMKAGPCGNLIVFSGMGSMGRNMFCTWLFFTVANFVIGYLATMALTTGASFAEVFRFVGTAGILTYGTANILNGIWFSRRMVGDILDGIAYGLITGAIFAWLWPAAMA